MRRAWVFSFWLLCLATMIASAQVPDDLEGDQAAPEDVVDQFERICITSEGNLSNAWELALASGWTAASDVPFEQYFWGVMPYHRVGLTAENHPGIVLLLSAQGNVTRDQRTALKAGQRPSSNPIAAKTLLETSKLLGRPEPGWIGGTECMISGRVHDMGFLYPIAEPLIHPPGIEGKRLVYSRTGRTDHVGAYEVIYQNLGSHVNLNIGYRAPDGSGGFHLTYSHAISLDDPVEIYTLPIWQDDISTVWTAGTGPH
ncbi:MAG: hypothetical protein IE925_10480 [Rhodobacterales bacterium]|nr:hypothetical protein [Rhodobacterales bacterium]